MEDESASTDLPLLANVEEVLVDHYVLILKCDFNLKCFVDCSTYLYLTPAACVCSDPGSFRLVLDSKDLDVHLVEEVEVCGSSDQPCVRVDSNVAKELLQCSSKKLQFKVEPWCIRIWKDGAGSQHWPRLVRIQYKTSAKGSSVAWCKDQNDKDCCYTHGDWINNRSLFPCQEPPTAMASWQAFITVQSGATVVVSGDQEPALVDHNCNSDEEQTFYSYTAMKLPMATLALAIGFWNRSSLLKSPSGLKSCLYSAIGLLSSKQITILGRQLTQVTDAAQHLLGPYPFPRLDILVLPRSYDSLGLASPNVVFLSQSVAIDADGSLLGVRLAHEVAHGWFGLLIGAKDWTEEWLSEGFASYMEDIIFVKTVNWSDVFIRDWREIRNYLRYQNLTNELKENDTKDLQMLRPNKGEIIMDRVKNGLNPDKGFMQVHYLKGYFVLNYLSNFVGEDEFLKVLKMYVEVYTGQLVSSQEIFKLFLSKFPCLGVDGLTVESICEQWLDCDGIPTALKDFQLSTSNCLYTDIVNEAKWLRHFNKLKRRKKSKVDPCTSFSRQEFCSEQKILLLELLLQDKHLSKRSLGLLRQIYKLDESNAEVRHRWCELVIKHNYTQGLDAVKKFLFDDQGMGIYLYGELMLSEKYQLQRLAQQCWERVQNEASYSTANVVREMLGIT